jgi:hypothetical protein
MMLEAIFLIAGIGAVVIGVATLVDARRYLRHSGPWTRRVRAGVLELLGGVMLFVGHDHPWLAWPAVLAMWVITFAPGLAVKDAVDHAALKPPGLGASEADRRRLE